MPHKKILVTGSTGFIGRALCLELVKKGYSVYAVARRPQFAPDGTIPVYVDEINSQTNIRSTLKNIDVVLHVAGKAHAPRQQNPKATDHLYEINVLGTLHIAQQAFDENVKRFVFISSIGVNGAKTSCSPFTEKDVPYPQSPYAQSKYTAEQSLQNLAKEKGKELVIVRPPLVYGPDAPGNFRLLLSAILKRLPLPFAAVKNRRSFLALDNLIDFLSLCADRDLSPAAANEVFLVSDGEDVSTPEFLTKISNAFQKKLLLVPVPPMLLRASATFFHQQHRISGLLDSLVIDNSKATRLLHWQPKTTMDEQLMKIAHEMKRT